MKRIGLLMFCLLGLAACSNPEKVARYTIDPAPVKKTLPNRLGSAELREVSLPQYATAQEIPYQTTDGALRSNPDNLWADDPARAMTLALARQISEASGATVLSAPWPFTDPPQRYVEVRIEQMLPGADGALHVAGVYIVSPSVAESGRDIVRRFDFTVPLRDQGPAAIAAAQGMALSRLAHKIAALD